MVHQRQGLTFGSEPSHHLLGTHAGLDDLQGDISAAPRINQTARRRPRNDEPTTSWRLPQESDAELPRNITPQMGENSVRGCSTRLCRAACACLNIMSIKRRDDSMHHAIRIPCLVSGVFFACGKTEAGVVFLCWP